MNDAALLFALGIARPRARDALDAFRDLLPRVAARDGARRRILDERTTAGLMLGQVLCRNAPCKDAVRRAQVELGPDASCSTAAFCKARTRVRVSTLDAMSAALSAKADALVGLDGFSGVHAVDVTTFQASDTQGNRSEWPYAPGQKPGCGFRDEEIVVVTSLLDPEKYPRERILEWYLRRWEIEVSFRDMKTTLRYEFIRGRSPRAVRLGIAALLLAYNLMRYVMARGRVPGERRGIASTAAAVMAFMSTVPVLYAAGRSCARAIAKLVAAVAADTLEKRRRKPYERAVKRRPKPCKLLTKPRSEYRQEVTA